MVRLKEGLGNPRLFLQAGFNSTMVRLKVWTLPTLNPPCNCFNSTMVRLKARLPAGVPDTANPFQFHNGSIKSAGSFSGHRWKTWFQFHNGSIKSAFGANTTWLHDQFQFHNGSIKRDRSQFYRDGIGERFNSTMVRLKVTRRSIASSAKATVSIPQWFD